METALLDLASRLRDLPARRGDPPWPGHEYVKGWGVFGRSFESGHVLALRVFPENDFPPYRTRDPHAPAHVLHRPGNRGLDDEDLGHAIRVSPNPQIGQVPLPARGVLAVGQAAWAILDNDDHTLTPREATGSPEGDHLPAGRHRGRLCEGGHGVDTGKGS